MPRQEIESGGYCGKTPTHTREAYFQIEKVTHRMGLHLCLEHNKKDRLPLNLGPKSTPNLWNLVNNADEKVANLFTRMFVDEVEAVEKWLGTR